MKGKIWVESEGGKGTRCYFDLRLVEVESRTIQYFLPEMEPGSYQWNEKTILIAEDDNNNYFFLRSTLKSTGAKIIRAKDGKQAVSAVKKHENINLVLMDIQMPEMNGYEATQNIKLLRPELPVISQTAYAMSGEREKSFKAGCDDYISKPIDIDLLFSKMSRYLNVGVTQEN
jgi:CheY-like chemotaxis protein